MRLIQEEAVGRSGDKLRADIQALRAFAVIAVLLFHVDFRWAPAGFLGVDVFFVISGFIITRLLLSQVAAGTFSFKDFYLRRLRRILPAATATVVLTMIAGYFVLSVFEFRALSASALHSLLPLANIHFWMQSGYFDESSTLKPLLHMWSLSVEEQFYLVWPLLIVASAAWGGKAVLWMVVAIGTASLTAAHLTTTVLEMQEVSFFWMTHRAFQLAIGAGLCFLPQPRKGTSLAYAIGLAAVTLSVVAFNEASAKPGLASLLPCLGAGACIYFGRSALAQRLAVPPVQWLGDISYSLYLAHWPVIVLYRFAAWRFEPFSPTEQACLLAGSLALGYALFVGVERPMRQPGFWTRFNSAPAFSGVLVFVAAIYVSATAWATDGWSFRLHWAVQQALDELPSLEDGSHRARDAALTQPFPAAGGNNIVVIGDSHAGDVISALGQNGAKHLYWIEMPYKCQLAVGPRPIETGSASRAVQNEAEAAACESRFDRALENPMLKEVGTVVLASRWKRWAAKRIDRTLEAFKAATPAQIIVFGPAAEYTLKVPAIVARYGRKEGVNRYAARFHDREVWRLSADLGSAVRAKGAVYVDTLSILCSDGICPVFAPHSNTLTYFDEDHWSAAGARYFGELLAQKDSGAAARLLH